MHRMTKRTDTRTDARKLLDAETNDANDAKWLFATQWRTIVGRPIQDCGWRTEHEFHDTRLWSFDWAHVGTRIAVEVDGGQRMARISPRTGRPVVVGRHATDDDHWKIATAVSMRWHVFQFTPSMLENDPRRCIELVAQFMGITINNNGA